ncbi:MAG: hypothetical protein ABJA67_18050 [Chthonomonadales bacterium]
MGARSNRIRRQTIQRLLAAESGAGHHSRVIKQAAILLHDRISAAVNLARKHMDKSESIDELHAHEDTYLKGLRQRARVSRAHGVITALNEDQIDD